MKNLSNMMKQAQEMQEKMQQLQEGLAEHEVTGAAGGGMVQVTMNGKGEMRGMTIDPSLVDPNDVSVLEDLVVAAANDAKKKVEEHYQEKMQEMTGGMNLPEGFKFPGM